MARPIVKYLDPVSGGYEFATVVDIGDLRNLNTTIKSDIVGAINSIISDGVHNPVNDERIENLETIIDSLKDGTFQIEDFGSIDEHLKQKFLEELDKINAQNREEMQSVLTKLDTSVDDAIRGYQEKVAAQNIILENAENTLVDARGTLEAKAAELETAKIGFSELKTEFDELDGYITTNIKTIDFDNFNAMVEDYETIVTQTSTEVGVDMSGSTLSYLTGRVTEAEANISAQADEITSKMSYDEFQYMPVPKYSYGENLLFDTFDFGDAWSGKNGAQVTPDTFLFGKVVAFNSPTGLYETRTDDLTIGESYVLSTYVNVQPSKKSPSQDKYEPISTSYDPTDFKVQIGGKSFNPGVYEDLSGINGWVRINQEFVADAVNPIISITPVGVNSQSEVAYMAMPKVEKGLTVTPWQPHVEDNYATISSTQSMIKQQANSITAFVTEVSELDDSYKQATSTFKMLADGFEANTEAVKNYEDAVIRYGTEYSNINGKFEQKVWKDDFKTAIEDINIDNRNRVLNSDFIRSEISSSDRRLIVEDWSLNSDWEIKTIDNDKYLSRNRTGLTQNLITSASSNYFPVRNGERILFGFDLIHSGLDNDKVFAIELFDISDKRLLKQEFSLSSLTKVGNRYHGSFSISTPGVEKGSVVLQLPKNGSVSFTKILFQNADIGSVDWSPAPEDSWIIQSKLETYISQVEDEITIGGTGQKLDTLTGLLTEDKGTFTLNPDKIASEVLNSKTYDDMGFVNKTNFEQTADGWIQEITSEGRLAGYINASPDTYRISFDKILLEGTTWADALGSSKIMVTENFALIGKNGKPVLDVKNDGSINMNITSLKIGEYNALTTNDKSDIESEVADKVINTTKPYVHIAYADTEDGQGLSFNPSGKQYIGFAKSHLPTPSGTASNYEWSKYVGADGYEGADGVGIKSTTVRYASSTSGTSQPSTGWSSTIPTVEPGNYLWTEVVWEYTNNEKKKSYTVARIGEDGRDGVDGVAGKDGVGIKSTTITYGVSPNETTQPATYTPTVPTLVKGQYLWTKTVWVYTDSTTETGYTKTYIPKDGNTGKDGIAGKDGVGISKTTITYAKSTNGTTAPTTGYTTTVPSANPGEFVWTKTVWTYTDNTTETGYSVGKIGNTGATGANGKDGVAGKDGVGIQKTEVHYASSTSGTTKPSTGWNLTVPTTSPGNYLWTRTTWTYTDGSKEEGYSVSRIGKDGNTGKDGIAGKDGVGIKSTVINYATSSSGTTKPTSGWTSTVPSVTPGNYLWTRTVWTYTDNDVETGYSVSRIGKDGTDGTNGKDGTGIKSSEISYVIHTNGTTAPTLGWVSTVPSPVKGRYLWTRTITTYTDNTTSTTYSVAYQATDGQRGDTGAAGNGVSSTTVTYAQTTSGTTTPTSWSSTRPAPIKGQYLWSRTIITYTNGSSSTAYNTSYSATDGQKGDKGDKGDTGPQGPRGIQGPSGSNGQSQWVHIRYSPNSTGSGMTTNPSSTTKYVGIAVTNSATAPAYTGFTWSKYVGEDGSRGPQGLPGKNGDDGTTTYTWIRYADTPTSGMSQYPDGKKYIGMAFNKTTQTESSNYSDYQWSLMPQNIEIGGRNLLKTTSNELKSLSTGLWYNSVDGGTTSDLSTYGLSVGDTVTFKVYIKSIAGHGGSARLTLFKADGTYSSHTGSPIENGKNGYSVVTVKIPTDRTRLNVGITNSINPGVTSSYLQYKEAKLEKGNKATDWSPAPEDVQSQIDNIEGGIGDLYLADKTGVLSGQEVFTDKADEGGLAHVEVDGKSSGWGNSLIIGGNKPVTNNSYGMADYQLTHEGKSLTVNDNVVIVLKGNLGSDRESFRAYNSGGSSPSAALKSLGKGYYVYQGKWFMPDISTANTYLRIYQFTSSGKSSSSIEWIKLYRGTEINYDLELHQPDPDYPIEIHDLNNFDIVSSVGRENLIKNSSKYDYNSTSTILHVDITPDLKEKLIVGQNYTFSFDTKADTPTSSSRVFINSTTTITKNITFSTNWTRHHVTFTYDGGYYSSIGRQIHPHIYPSGSGMKYIRDIKLEKGNVATSREPDLEGISENSNHPLIDKINLVLDEPLAGVGDVKDQLFRDDDGLWKIRRKIAREKLSNLTLVSTDPNGGNSYLFDDSVAFICTLKEHISTDKSTWGNKIISSHFREVTGNNYNWNKNGGNDMPGQIGTVHQISGTEYQRVFVRVPNSTIGATMNDSLSTLNSKMAKWARENDIDLQYHARNESVEVLPMSTQNKLNSLSSFAKSNYVYTVDDNNIKPNLNVVFKSKGWKHKFATDTLETEIKDKVSTEDLTDVSNDLNTSIGDLSNTVDGKVDTSIYEQFLEHNANIQEQLSISTANAQEDITKALARTATVEQKLGEGAADWIFTHTQIRMSDEGITLGEQGSGSYLQITNDQISFYNGSEDPVAFINGGMLNINHAIFVESIQISQFMFSSEVPGHLTLRYVGN